MKKKIIIGSLVCLILVLLFPLSINASIFATIGMRGLSFASPEAAKVVQTTICISNPVGCAAGYVTQQVSGEALKQISQQNPEIVQAVQQYNKVKGWVDEGAQIAEDLKINEKAELTGGKIVINEKEQDVSSLTNSKNKEGSIKTANMEMSSKGEGEDVTFTAKKGAHIEINGKRYENMKEGSVIKIRRDGSINEADITTTEAGTYDFGGKQIQAEKDTRIVYKDSALEVYGKEKTVQIDEQKIKINGESIRADGQKITGKDFTLDEKRFTGIEEKNAELTLVKEGYLLGKNTEAENQRMIVTSNEGNVLLSKTCQDISGFNNYANPCKTQLDMQGEGFSVQLKEGKNFGLNIEKDDTLKYELHGSKVTLQDGKQTMLPEEKGSALVTNGEVTTKYTKLAGITQELIDPDEVGKVNDVSLSTEYDEIVSITDDKTNAETEYACSVDTSEEAVTGAFNLLEKCKEVVGLNKGNKLIGKELGDLGIITEESKIEEFKTSDGKMIYNKIITTDQGKFSIYSSGEVLRWNDAKLRWEHMYYTDESALKELGIPQTKEITGSPLPKTQPSKDFVTGMEERGQKAWDEAEKNKQEKGVYYAGPITKGGDYMYLQPMPGSNIRHPDFIGEKKPDGTFESLDGTKKFVPLGGGKFKLVTR